jgi:hypothetical protein
MRRMEQGGVILQPKSLRAEAFYELEHARKMNAGAWPRSDTENAFARAQILATLAVEEQVQRLRLQMGIYTVCILVALVSLVVVVS